MPRKRTESAEAADKLISAIQKEWGEELGESVAEVTEQIMDLAHELLQAHTAQAMAFILGSRTITQYLGELWVELHPSVVPAIAKLGRWRPWVGPHRLQMSAPYIPVSAGILPAAMAFTRASWSCSIWSP